VREGKVGVSSALPPIAVPETDEMSISGVIGEVDVTTSVGIGVTGGVGSMSVGGVTSIGVGAGGSGVGGATGVRGVIGSIGIVGGARTKGAGVASGAGGAKTTGAGGADGVNPNGVNMVVYAVGVSSTLSSSSVVELISLLDDTPEYSLDASFSLTISSADTSFELSSSRSDMWIYCGLHTCKSQCEWGHSGKGK